MEIVKDPIDEQFNKLLSSKKSDSTKRKVEYDVKNYLNVRLTGKEIKKTIQVRILKLTPDDLDTDLPFKEVYNHFFPATKQSFICAKKTEGLPEGVEKSCPFCDLRDRATEAQRGADQALYNRLKEVRKQNDTTTSYICRVIDREDESFGPKFWKISKATLENIREIYTLHKKANINIFDTITGRDLIVTIKNDENKSKISNISADLVETKLANTQERINEIITDNKLWSDVYGIKPYDYLEIIINGGTPFFDKANSKWVPKITQNSFNNSSNEDDDDDDDDPFEVNEKSDFSNINDDLPF